MKHFLISISVLAFLTAGLFTTGCQDSSVTEPNVSSSDGIFMLDTGTSSGEGTWAKGEFFRNKGSWAMYFQFVGSDTAIPLVMGRQMNPAGMLHVSRSDTNYTVIYHITEGTWKLKCRQFGYGEVIEEMIGRNPKIGHFQEKMSFTDPYPTWDTIMFLGPAFPDSIYMAAHGDLVDPEAMD